MSLVDLRGFKGEGMRGSHGVVMHSPKTSHSYCI